jgi:hypothetical protein
VDAEEEGQILHESYSETWFWEVGEMRLEQDFVHDRSGSDRQGLAKVREDGCRKVRASKLVPSQGRRNEVGTLFDSDWAPFGNPESRLEQRGVGRQKS